MKKLFTLFAALCCVVFSAKATDLADGIHIKVGSTAIVEENKAGVTPDMELSLKSGKVSYDTQTHTLTLDNAVIEGDYANAQVFVNNGYDNDFDVTIKLIGKNRIVSTVTRALWLQHLKEGKAFIITGEQGATLDVEGVGGAIVARRDYTSDADVTADIPKYYHILKIQGGCKVEAINNGSSAAVRCYQLEVNASDLHIWGATSALEKASSDAVVLTDVTQTANYSDEKTYARELYPIWYGGTQLSSACSEISKRFGWGSVGGGLYYDGATRTLTMNAFTGSSYVTIEDNNSTEPIIIAPKGACTPTGGLTISSPVTITGSGETGNSLSITTTSNQGILLNKGPLTLENGANVYAKGNKYGVLGIETSGEFPTVILKASNLTVYGTNEASFAGVNLSIPDNDVALTAPSGAAYVAANYQVELSGSAVKGENVVFEKTVFFATVGIQDGQGTVSLLQGGSPKQSPLKIEGGATEITFKAEPASGYKFGYWVDEMLNVISTEATYNCNVGTDMTLKAVFFMNMPSDSAWYAVKTSSTEMGELTDMTSFNKLQDFANATINNISVIGSSVSGRIFIYTEDNGTQVGLFYRTYNSNTGEWFSSAYTLRNAQTTYHPVTAMTWDYCAYTSGGALYAYMAANKAADNKYVLLQYDSGGNASDPIGTELCDLDASAVPFGYPIVGMVSDAEGNLFAIARGKANTNAWLYSVNKTTGAMVPLVDTKIAYKVDYTKQSLAEDVQTGKFIWSHPEGAYTVFTLIDKDEQTVGTVGRCEGNYAGIFQWKPAIYRVEVSVKEGCEEQGVVTLPGGNLVGTYFEGREVTVMAAPQPGCKFVKWSDGSTDAIHTFTAGGDIDDMKLVAEFSWSDDITAYPIWIGGKQLHSGRSTMSSLNNDAISAGSISFDATKNALVLNNLTMSSSAAGNMICIGSEGLTTKINISVPEGTTNTVTGTLSATPLKLVAADVTVSGEGSVTFYGVGVGALLSKGSKLTFEGANATVKGLSYGIKSNDAADNDELVVRGSNLTLDGGTNASSVASYDVAAVSWKYVTTNPTNAVFNATSKRITEGEGGANVKKVIFAPIPTLRGKAVEDGSATFMLSAGDDSFENIGWFANGTKVTVTASATSGYEFAYWLNDTKWNQPDDENHIGETREITKGSGDETVTAMCYYNAKSSADWFGWNSNKPIMFNLSNRHALDVARANQTVATIHAGDYEGSYWILLDGSTLRRLSISSITDGEKVVDTWNDENVEPLTCAGLPSGILDMAYDYVGSAMYAVTPSALYDLDYNYEQKATKLGDFKFKGAAVTNITAIAVDATGKKYVLGAGSPGRLYTVSEIVEEGGNKNVNLEYVGEDGNIKADVTSGEQSLAFDHVTGELIWGAADYMRVIDVTTAESHIAGALGWSKGAQGFIKGLHRMDRRVTVKVEVAEDSKDMGTATVNDKDKCSAFAGAKVTLTATPASGYKFVKWIRKVGQKENEFTNNDKSSLSVSASSATYVAHFAKDEQGIEDVNASEMKGVQKLLIDGTIYIIRDGAIYTITGERVK